MLVEYDDIKDKLGEPLWYDENGVPRYCDFHPDQCGVYNDYVALLRIACQDCHREFLVASAIVKFHALTWLFMTDKRGVQKAPILPEPSRGILGHLHYGDPPRHGCVGDTMNCDDLEVVEWWQRPHLDWERDPTREGKLPEQLD